MKEYVIKLVNINVFGNINEKGSFSVDEKKTIIDVLKKDAKGMVGEKNLEIAQVGGPLGQFVAGEELLNPVTDYIGNKKLLTIMFLNDKFCPVDYSKFLLGHVKKEMGIQSKELKILEDLIEELSSGSVRKYSYDELVSELNEPSLDVLVMKVKENIKYLMARYEDVFMEHFEHQKCRVGICNRLFTAQCVNACPAGIDIPGYIALMYQGQDEDAYKLMRQNNPLSLICGKICARPCEERCRRGEIEQTVGVRALKHYAATAALENDDFIEEQWKSNGKRIGIIGAGPAGISAAYYLIKTGYAVDVYEKHPVVGGMLALGVPSYRLAQESIDKEVQLIKNLGVKIFTNTEVGKDISFKALEDQYDSVVLSTGCHLPNLFSDHLENLESAIEFLRDVKLDKRTKVGTKVVVIGGGDVAMDASRTALRLGAERVDVVSLESYMQMPANDEEKEEALEEGVIMHSGFGTKEIHESNNVAKGISLKRVTNLYDLNNHFNPVYDEEDTFDLDCDHIILAIGQRSDISYLESSLDVDSRNRLIVGKRQTTSKEGVYVAGDLGGPGSAIKAIAEGKSVAEEIDRYLNGKGLYRGTEIKVPDFQSHYSIWDTEGKVEPVQLFTQGCENGFEENRKALTEVMARAEALRCMRCDRNSRQ